MTSSSLYRPNKFQTVLVAAAVIVWSLELTHALANPQSPALPLSGLPAFFGGNGDSGGAIFSGDGRWLVFTSLATDLTTNRFQNGIVNVFAHDLESHQTVLVSQVASGDGGDANSTLPWISTNGRWVAFESQANHITAEDTNGARDVFVRDLFSGSTRLVSVNTNGASGNALSYNPLLTADGTSVVFHSLAGDLIPGDTNLASDLFVRDLSNHTSALVHGWTNAMLPIKVSAPAASMKETAQFAQISGDGRYIVYHSAYPTRATVSSTYAQVYMRDRQAEKTILISTSTTSPSGSIGGNQNSTNPVISWDGSSIAFLSRASDLTKEVLGNAPLGPPPYLVLCDWRQAKKAVVASTEMNSSLKEYALSPDGAYLAYFKTLPVHNAYALCVVDIAQGTTVLSNQFAVRGGLVASLEGQYLAFSARNGSNYIWMHYLYAMGDTHLISLDLPADAMMTGISSDGQNIAFTSRMKPGQSDTMEDCQQVYVLDRSTGLTSLISQSTDVSSPVPQWNAIQITPQCLSADGRWLVFASADHRLATNDFNSQPDVFLVDTGSGQRRLISQAFDGSGPAAGASREAVISGDGRYVLFTSRATNLVDESADWSVVDGNPFDGLFIWSAQNNQCQRLDKTTAGRPFHASLSGDGSVVAYNARWSVKEHRLVVLDWPSHNELWLETNAFASVPSSMSLAVSPNGKQVAVVENVASLSQPSLSLIDLINHTKVFIPTYTNVYTSKIAGSFLSPVFSSDAPVLVFLSNCRNLTTNASGPNFGFSVFVHRLDTRATVLASMQTNGRTSNVLLEAPAVSANGRWVVFASDADLAKTGETNRWHDIFLRDLENNTTELISVNAKGNSGGNGHSFAPSISADGRYVVFQSRSSDLVSGDDNQCSDVFLRDRWSRTTRLLSLRPSPSMAMVSSQPILSHQGQVIVFRQAFASVAEPALHLLGEVFWHAFPGRILLDADQDGLDDAWEINMFGNLEHNADGDFDQDGWINGWEFQLGLAPGTPDPALVLAGPVSQGADGWRFEWLAAEGAQYRIQYKENLDDPEWLDLPVNLSIFGNRGFCLDSSSASLGHRFYRLVAGE
jgi:Tol biopolymer transport system component